MTLETLELLITLIPLSYVAGAMIPIISSDITQGRVPNKIVLPMLATTLLCWLTLAIWQGEWAKFGISILLLVATTILGLFLHAKFQLIGMGDVKLMATLTMILSWFSWGFALLFMPAIVLSAFIFGLFIVLVSRMTMLRLAPVVFATFATLIAISFN